MRKAARDHDRKIGLRAAATRGPRRCRRNGLIQICGGYLCANGGKIRLDGERLTEVGVTSDATCLRQNWRRSL